MPPSMSLAIDRRNPQRLEPECMQLFLGGMASAERPATLSSSGKDSTALLHLESKAFRLTVLAMQRCT
jgi:3'-phosphoadenosine 5'-phosphosulfate sulfotransferase (PAPS reductase)/FAD synthetase